MLSQIDLVIGIWSMWVVYVHVYGNKVCLFREVEKRGVRYKRIRIELVLLVVMVLLWKVLLKRIVSDELTDAIGAGFGFLLGHLMIFCIADTHRIRKSFWFWPIAFTSAMPGVLLQDAMYCMGINWNENGTKEKLWGDLVILLVFGSLWIMDRKLKFSERVYREESFLVGVVCTAIAFLGASFMNQYVAQLEDLEYIAQLEQNLRVYIVLSFCALGFLWYILRVGGQADHYERLSEIYEKNARETLAFYESYKEAQAETRKMRHDMKNHYACMQVLVREKKYQELEVYLDSFHESLGAVSMEIQTGNDILDAIMNAKYQSAKKDEITFLVQGVFPRELVMEAMDQTKLFSNAIDNAVEAMVELPKEQRVFSIQLKNNGNFLSIRMENPYLQKEEYYYGGRRTSKKDVVHHGFGLKNMESAVKKYKGEIDILQEQRGETKFFVVDIIMPIRQELGK